MPTIRWRSVIIAALGLAALIHIDWHLARPPYDHLDHLSFNLRYHWLLGVVALSPLPWLFSRHEALLVVAIGVLIGQGVEPLGELMLYGDNPFAHAPRWRAFGEFMAAGLFGYVMSAVWRLRRLRVAPTTTR